MGTWATVCPGGMVCCQAVCCSSWPPGVRVAVTGTGWPSMSMVELVVSTPKVMTEKSTVTVRSVGSSRITTVPPAPPDEPHRRGGRRPCWAISPTASRARPGANGGSASASVDARGWESETRTYSRPWRVKPVTRTPSGQAGCRAGSRPPPGWPGSRWPAPRSPACWRAGSPRRWSPSGPGRCGRPGGRVGRARTAPRWCPGAGPTTSPTPGVSVGGAAGLAAAGEATTPAHDTTQRVIITAKDTRRYPP